MPVPPRGRGGLLLHVLVPLTVSPKVDPRQDWEMHPNLGEKRQFSVEQRPTQVPTRFHDILPSSSGQSIPQYAQVENAGHFRDWVMIFSLLRFDTATRVTGLHHGTITYGMCHHCQSSVTTTLKTIVSGPPSLITKKRTLFPCTPPPSTHDRDHHSTDYAHGLAPFQNRPVTAPKP